MPANGSLTGLRAELDAMEPGDVIARVVRRQVDMSASDALDAHRRAVGAAVAKAKQRDETRDYVVQTLDGLTDGVQRVTRAVIVERLS